MSIYAQEYKDRSLAAIDQQQRTGMMEIFGGIDLTTADIERKKG